MLKHVKAGEKELKPVKKQDAKGLLLPDCESTSDPVKSVSPLHFTCKKSTLRDKLFSGKGKFVLKRRA